MTSGGCDAKGSSTGYRAPAPTTSDGLRIAIFYTEVHNRLLVPLTAADRPPDPELRATLATIDRHITQACLPNAA